MVNTGTIKVIEDQSVMIFSGKVLARDVPYEEYLAGGFGQHTEWHIQSAWSRACWRTDVCCVQELVPEGNRN